MRTSFIAWVAALACVAGCSSSSSSPQDAQNDFPDDQLTDNPANPGKADYFNIPFATFRATDPTPPKGRFLLLANPNSGITHREVVKSCTDTCVTEGQDLVVVWSKGGSTSYVRFMDDNGTVVDRYAFQLKDNDTTLRLRKVNTSTWQELTLSDDPWCQEESSDPQGRQDCSGQIDVHTCAGSWSCVDHHCIRACDYDACGKAGAQCVASSDCTNGTVGDAMKYPCPSGQACCFSGHSVLAFDPISADNLGLAFAAGQKEAAKAMTHPTMSFLMLAGTPTADGASYADIPYQWVYSLVGQASGNTPTQITVTYPGWTTKNLHGMPMGSYMSQDDFAGKIKLTFGQLIDKLATEGVSLQTCPMGPSGGFLDVKGTFGPQGQRWYWEFFCADQGQTLLTFDAATGSPLQ